MISIQIKKYDIKKISANLNQKILGMEQVVSPASLTQISKAAFTIVGKEFLRSINRDAKTEGGKKFLQHMYEWNKSGINTQRLFKLMRRYVAYGNLSIETKFLKSRVNVPVDKKLLTPGKTGKFVTRRHIFRDKAQVMEAGKPVTINTVRTIVFLSKSKKMVFVPENRKIIIRNPGGYAAKRGYTQYSKKWFNKTNFRMAMEKSQIFERIEKSVTRVLNTQNGRPSDVRRVVSEICQKYSGGITRL